MSRGPKSEPGADWRPAASFANLRRRAALLTQLRAFFAARGVLEVETPLLAAATVTDLHLASFSVRPPGGIEGGTRRPRAGSQTLYLQTSPEFAMKRLVAAGSGPIYQIAKAFRRDEAGRAHNPEFTILEWYRPGWDHHALLDEIDELLGEVLAAPAAERVTYGELFERRLGVDPHRDPVERLRRAAAEHGIDMDGMDGMDGVDVVDGVDRDTWLQLLLSHVLEPRLGRGRPTFVLDFPASQAALARLRPPGGTEGGRHGEEDPPVAERFEVYVEGLELANGFHELADAAEQRRRFEHDLARRHARSLEQVPIDERLLAALEAGFPDCAGVALGVDRLAMLVTGASHLDEVVAFPIGRA